MQYWDAMVLKECSTITEMEETSIWQKTISSDWN